MEANCHKTRFLHFYKSDHYQDADTNIEMDLKVYNMRLHDSCNWTEGNSEPECTLGSWLSAGVMKRQTFVVNLLSDLIIIIVSDFTCVSLLALLPNW